MLIIKYAKLQVLKIRNRTTILKSQPRLGKVVMEVDKPDIREIAQGSYRGIYKIVSSKQIDILTIHHSARDLTRRKIK